MKILITSLLVALVALSPVLAQTTINAKDIIAKINRKEAVSYQNATITGDLDLTGLANRKEVREGNWGDSQQYLSTVDVPMTFRNCTFKGKFLGYRTEDQDGKLFRTSTTVFNTDFPESVTIEGCTFEEDATFKYSMFSQRAIFSNNKFEKVALFKYTKFRNDADFSNTTFQNDADFKYTRFYEASTFQKARFGRSADFKYTKFDEGTNFSQARFTGSADFKYTHLPNGSNFDEARFDGSTDFKYTTLGGRRFLPSGR